MPQQIKDYYFIFDIENNNYIGLLFDEDIYNLQPGYKAYKLDEEQISTLNDIIKKKIRSLSFTEKLKLIFGRK